ncbi:MAG: SIS domain-containing protein [Mediterraneibacter gnavus]
MLSVSGEDEEMVSLLNQYKESGAFVISITNTEQCLIAKMSDINFSCYMPETYGKNTGSVRGSQLPVIYILESLSAIISFRE